MQTDINNFIENQSNEKLTLVRWVVNRSSATGKTLDEIIRLTKDELIDIIIKMKPSNIKMVTNFVYVFNLYAKFVNDSDAVEIISSLDRKEIWKRYKENGLVTNRFISNEEFEDLIYNIEITEELNSLYYTTLLKCIYNGMYSDDLSVIKNLRGHDINFEKSIITLRKDNGISYCLNVSNDLIEDLGVLSQESKWDRINRYGIYSVDTNGIYQDSCFKVETRGSGNNYRYSYFDRIRKISKNYLERPLKPMNIYVSGLMHRICINLIKDGQSPLQAFTEHTRTSYPIIQAELSRCGYERDVKYLRQMVHGHLEEFGIF